MQSWGILNDLKDFLPGNSYLPIHMGQPKKFDILLVLVLDITHNLNKAIIQDLDGKEKSYPFESVH